MFFDAAIDSCMPTDIIQQILSWTYPWQLRFAVKLMDYTRTLRYYKNGWPFKWLVNIEWVNTYNIPRESFDFTKKKSWIAMYARLRNASDFIIPSVESNLPFFDEIILMENGWSTDDTIDKCTFLQKKYPQKIRFFIYEPEVHKLFSEEHKTCPNNSIHNFSYASNYLLSKVSYKYAVKLDDDHLWIPKKISATTKKIRQTWLTQFLITPLINVQKDQNNSFCVAGDNYRSTYAWLFGDFWFHPVCHNIYFHSNAYTEWYLHNLSSLWWPTSFLHLKLLKRWKWLHNYHQQGHTYLKNYYQATTHLPLAKTYIDLLHHYGIYENW